MPDLFLSEICVSCLERHLLRHLSVSIREGIGPYIAAFLC